MTVNGVQFAPKTSALRKVGLYATDLDMNISDKSISKSNICHVFLYLF